MIQRDVLCLGLFVKKNSQMSSCKFNDDPLPKRISPIACTGKVMIPSALTQCECRSYSNNKINKTYHDPELMNIILLHCNSRNDVTNMEI